MTFKVILESQILRGRPVIALETMSAALFPMISVDSALAKVLQQTVPLCSEEVDSLSSCGRIIAAPVTAVDPFPSFRASIMDGYAVIAPLSADTIVPVQLRVLAGDVTGHVEDLHEGNIAYITTGARVPDKANAVVKIEDTEKLSGNQVRLKVNVLEGTNIRFIGSDIAVGDIIVDVGQPVEPAEIGLLACAGVTSVHCYKRPIVGVMSTGDELVELNVTPTGSQVRDSNRPALIASLRRDNYEVIDYGIIRDVKSDLEQRLLQAVEQCDVLITSGGVSMGDADFVKPLLAKLGTIHFGRLNMKPGKPTTFATIASKSASKKTLVFGLPGNPVSCLVTKSLLIDPCLRRLQGVSVERTVPPQLTVRLQSNLKLDLERPEYHRAQVITSSAYPDSSLPVAISTGDQRSSRLLSMRSSNALLCLPQGSASKPQYSEGQLVTALLIGALPSPHPSRCYHKEILTNSSSNAILVDDTVFAKPSTTVSTRPVVKVGLLTISDRASQGIYEDLSGPEMRRQLDLMNAAGVAGLIGVVGPGQDYNIQAEVVVTAVVPDEIVAIQSAIKRWVDEQGVDLVMTSGGTGFGSRDVTPEAVRPLLHREAPGVAQALLAEGLKHTPLAVLSRPVVGTRGDALICTLPGSVKAVAENFQALRPLLPRIMQLLSEGTCHGKHL